MNIHWEDLVNCTVHDVRAHVRKALLNVGRLEHACGEAADPAVRERLEELAVTHRNLDRLMARIGQLAECASLTQESLLRDSQDLDLVVMGAKLEQRAALAQCGGELEIAKQAGAYKVPARLQFVVGELIANAIRFRSLDRPLHVTIRTDASDRKALHLYVEDNGIGWDAAYSGKLFRPFERLHADRSGAGLGLAICRGIVDTAGGSISAVPHDSGAVFQVEIPASFSE